ncbi:type IV toxin-antitoxin system AbiEi family antitoxin domain-containing protein [Ralstonia sp. A12]|uniref:type IV toxin-antitoxin system AbiEi family antitoxin domain-containing protein n=1 Tax=Ralstonia sp. A12 TaxID=1217052 RepID=UPI00069462B6|nr:hypothetical protein [Ralstonia sp. A12]
MYDLGVATLQIYTAKEYAGQKIKKLTADLPSRSNIHRYKNALMESGILEERRDLPRDTCLLVSSPHQEAVDLACGIDPFCYVSHLSAMAYHGLTDRFAKTLFLTTPTAALWRERAAEKQRKDLGEDLDRYVRAGFPLLARHALSSLNREPVHTYATKHVDPGAYVKVSDRPVRVASIGRTFLDMLRKPDLCGGMSHVINVFESNAPSYLRLILNEIDRHGEPIDKVRAGYILDERCGIHYDRIDQWVSFAQRGGSRVLDPGAPFWPQFSEKWCLSINLSV